MIGPGKWIYEGSNIVVGKDVIIKVATESLNTSMDDLLIKCRMEEYVFKRHIIIYLLRKHARMSAKNIGQLFCQKTANIMYVCKAIRNKLGNDEEVTSSIENILKKLYKMNIYVEDDKDIKSKLAEGVFNLHHLRSAMKAFNKNPSGQARRDLAEWEEKSDDFLKKCLSNETQQNTVNPGGDRTR